MNKSWIAGVAGILLGCLAVSAASAALTVVTFDDLPDGLVPDGYGGITWGGEWNVYSEAQPPYNPESPPARVFDTDPSGSFSFSTPTMFDGAYFSGYDFATVTFDLYNGANEVWTSGSLSPSGTPTWLPSGYTGLVTSVVVSSPSPDFFVMDNVTYGSAVPEPATWAMILAGFAGLALAGSRASRKNASAFAHRYFLEL